MANTRKPAKDKAEADATPETEAPITDDTPNSGDHTASARPADETSGAAQKAPGKKPQTPDVAGRTAPEGSYPDPVPDETPDAPAGQDDRPQSETPAPVVTTEQVIVRQGGFWAMLLGGVAAAGIGVLAASYVLPSQWFETDASGVEARVNQELAALDQRLNDLNAQIGGMSLPPDLSGEVDGLGETLAVLTKQMSALEARIATLEKRPQPETNDGVSEAELQDLRAMLEAQRAEVDALKAEAEASEAAARDSARATLRRAALTRILTALDSGNDFATALADLRETGVEVPAALADMAETGVPTQAMLTERFPDAARAALAEARLASGEETAGLGGFLKSQLGLRSLTPREGDDPDAVLSRAEAALGEGRLGDALAEIETLSEGARAALADWADLATRRKEALIAAEELAGTLN
ncbi:Uncharacterized conserved protein [Roseovarius azorensis]|uniref:Uncharacterized conserved protein n=1 Tax=Roseovarius azorensis TaxID=1287727 RepID=A0A1H7QYV2_9RHOB|nr:hypothetical protein [Roseovarius azorensis]SEL53190.1 Uncharacterized conserved protein [Roseovarius azorensis]